VRLYKASTANLLAMIDAPNRSWRRSRPCRGGRAPPQHLPDDSEDVRNGIKELRNTGLLGGGLAVLFMYLFLRRLRSTCWWRSRFRCRWS